MGIETESQAQPPWVLGGATLREGAHSQDSVWGGEWGAEGLSGGLQAACQGMWGEVMVRSGRQGRAMRSETN